LLKYFNVLIEYKNKQTSKPVKNMLYAIDYYITSLNNEVEKKSLDEIFITNKNKLIDEINQLYQDCILLDYLDCKQFQKYLNDCESKGLLDSKNKLIDEINQLFRDYILLDYLDCEQFGKYLNDRE
jgi:hypothetical protein